jgi:hypothetical protein
MNFKKSSKTLTEKLQDKGSAHERPSILQMFVSSSFSVLPAFPKSERRTQFSLFLPLLEVLIQAA